MWNNTVDKFSCKRARNEPCEVIPNLLSTKARKELLDFYRSKALGGRVNTKNEYKPKMLDLFDVYTDAYLKDLYSKGTPGRKASEFRESCKKLLKSRLFHSRTSCPGCALCTYFYTQQLLVYAQNNQIILPVLYRKHPLVQRMSPSDSNSVQSLVAFLSYYIQVEHSLRMDATGVSVDKCVLKQCQEEFRHLLQVQSNWKWLPVDSVDREGIHSFWVGEHEFQGRVIGAKIEWLYRGFPVMELDLRDLHATLVNSLKQLKQALCSIAASEFPSWAIPLIIDYLFDMKIMEL